MAVAIKIFIGFIAFIHLYILWFEMFAWTTRGRKVFRNFPADLFEKTKTMAAFLMSPLHKLSSTNQISTLNLMPKAGAEVQRLK